MLLFLFNFLSTSFGLKVPAVFTYYSTRIILSSVTALLLTIFLGPSFIRKLYELKIGQSIRKEECPLLGELHRNKENTPTMGGGLILSAMLISMLLWMDLTHSFTMVLFAATVVLGLVGARDDYLKLRHRNAKGLSGRKKLFVQGVFSLALAGYLLSPGAAEWLQTGVWFTPPEAREALGRDTLHLSDYAARVYVPLKKDPIFIASGVGLVALGIFYAFVITGASNAVNLTDGLDGLAAGLLIMVAGGFAVIAFLSNHAAIADYLNILYIEGSGEIAIYLTAFVGACIGFLWYNSPPAQVFMGDTGSLALGGILGVSAVLLRREFLLAIIGGLFVVEALSVIIQVGSFRLRNKRRVFLCAPLHHHFEFKGWPETKIVIRFWIIGLLLTLLGIASLKFQ